MSKVVHLDGEFLPAADARIGVDNGGWLHGAGLFETMRAHNGRVFRLDRHLNRLCASAETLLTRIDRRLLPDQRIMSRLLEENGFTDARVRLTVTAGAMTAGQPDERRPVTICTTASPLTPYPPELYDKGAAVLVSRFRQIPEDPLAGHKTTSYFSRLLALKQAHQAGCNEALWFTTQNLLAEGSISNVFIVKSNAVATPPLDTPVLPGVARTTVLDLCAQEDLKPEERTLTINDLLDADEVFLTNVIMQVMPVCQVEKREIGNGKPGPVTTNLLQRFRELIAKECESNGKT